MIFVCSTSAVSICQMETETADVEHTKITKIRVCGVRQNLYVYSLYRNPDLDDRIFDCLLASMAAVQTGCPCLFQQN